MIRMTREERFRVFESKLNGHRLVGSIDQSLSKYKEKEKTPWFLSIVTQISDPDHEGLPKAPEALSLNSWEDTIEMKIAGKCRFVFAGRVTWNSHRELLYYVDNPGRIVPELQDVINCRELRPFAFRCESDPRWEKVGVYLKGM